MFCFTDTKARVFAVSKATVTYSFQIENGFGSAISIQCENSEPLNFRQGTHSKYVMEKVKLLWGDGLLFDHEGYAITAESPVLSPGFYTCRCCLQSKYCIQPASVSSARRSRHTMLFKHALAATWVCMYANDLNKTCKLINSGQCQRPCCATGNCEATAQTKHFVLA